MNYEMVGLNNFFIYFHIVYIDVPTHVPMITDPDPITIEDKTVVPHNTCPPANCPQQTIIEFTKEMKRANTKLLSSVK